jgi:hypothetical protein
MHVCALEVVGEDFAKVVPGIDVVPQQVVQPDPSRFDQIDWKELDNEEIVVPSPRPSREAVVSSHMLGFVLPSYLMM